MRAVTVLGVPTSMGAHAPGQERAPEALRRAGLLELLTAAELLVNDLGDLPKVRWSPDTVSPRAQHAGLVAEVAERVAEMIAAVVMEANGDAGPGAGTQTSGDWFEALADGRAADGQAADGQPAHGQAGDSQPGDGRLVEGLLVEGQPVAVPAAGGVIQHDVLRDDAVVNVTVWDAGPADEVDDVLLVLGGDCTIEVGVVSGFERAGQRVGLIYLDAGADLNVPPAVRPGFLDWMGMAHLLGLPDATPELSRLGPRFPLLEPAQVVLAGTIDEELTDFERAAIAEHQLRVVWTEQVAADPAAAAAQVLGMFGPDTTCLLLHLDVDVIDFLDFPAADFPTINAGLTLDQAMAFVAAIATDRRFAALTVCEVNPDHLDEQQHQLGGFAARLADALRTTG